MLLVSPGWLVPHLYFVRIGHNCIGSKLVDQQPGQGAGSQQAAESLWKVWVPYMAHFKQFGTAGCL